MLGRVLYLYALLFILLYTVAGIDGPAPDVYDIGAPAALYVTIMLAFALIPINNNANTLKTSFCI